MKHKLSFIVLVAFLLSSGVLAQNRTISGRIVDAIDALPLPGVSVIVRESKTGISTNEKGEFTINVSAQDKNLDFSFIGYKSVSKSIIASKQRYDIKMEISTTGLDEIVVVGYGSQRKRDITGAISSLSAEDIESNSGGDLNIAMQGKIAGMDIVSMSGEPGAGANISIRGASSINGNSEPLYIIDGVPIEAGNIRTLDNDASFSPIAGINPNDIESIEVLKDAASASIYGSRAANGVVIITTKGGHKLVKTTPTINIMHTSSIVSNSRNLDVLNATEFREIFAESRLNNGQPVSTAWAINPFSPLYYRSTDWQQEMFRTSYQHVNDISLRGSSDSFSYSLSLGYKNLQPTIVHTSYDQFNGRANFTYKISKFLKASTNLTYTHQNYRRVLSGNGSFSVISQIVQSNPCFSPYDYETGELTDYLGAKETRNPLALAEFCPHKFNRSWTIMNQLLDFTITKGLSLHLSGTMETDKIEQTFYQPKRFDALSRNPMDRGLNSSNVISKWLTEDYLSYDFRTTNHKVNAILGISVQSYSAKETRLDGQDYLDSNIIYIQNANKQNNVAQNINENRMLSFFGRVNYSLLDRYIIAATIRRDGSSRFGSDKRFGTFPAASLGWRFSDESFMKWAKKHLDDAKLRLSWGMTGNNSIGNYAWRGNYQIPSTSGKYDGSAAILYTAPQNLILCWETTTQTNMGIDLSLFNQRVNITADAYIKRSCDLLMKKPTSYYTGFTSAPRNFGEIENRGLEFSIESINLKGKKMSDLTWRTTFNIAFNRSKVLELGSEQTYAPGSVAIAQVGKPLGLFYTYKAVGVYSRDEDNVYKVSSDGSTIPYRRGATDGEIFKGGDVIWHDADGNGIIDDNDRVIVGDPNPDFIGGLGNTLLWKGFTFNVMFQFCYGNDIMNEFRRTRDAMSLSRNTGRDILNRWQKQGDITNRPMIRYSDPMTNYRQSSMWLEDGSFLRLKSLSLSYAFKIKQLFIKSIKLTLTGTNLITWSKYSGYDPEVNTSNDTLVKGVDEGAYPKARTYNLGVNITF